MITPNSQNAANLEKSQVEGRESRVRAAANLPQCVRPKTRGTGMSIERIGMTGTDRTCSDFDFAQ